jgi:nuclear pore complex protein Nup188
MVYSVTQLAMWISKSKFDASGNGNGDMEVEPSSTAESQRGDNEQRKSAKATPLAERLRRGMTGEIADDLEALLKKAKTALEEGATVDPKQNLALVLSNFLKEHLTN